MEPGSFSRRLQELILFCLSRGGGGRKGVWVYLRQFHHVTFLNKLENFSEGVYGILHPLLHIDP